MIKTVFYRMEVRNLTFALEVKSQLIYVFSKMYRLEIKGPGLCTGTQKYIEPLIFKNNQEKL